MKKTNAIRLLESKKIRYKVREYQVTEDDLGAVAAAAKTGIDLDRIYKTLVLKGDRSGYLVGCIPGGGELDMKALAKASGNKRVEMIPMKDLERITGYIRGGCSPIGMRKAFPTYIDSLSKTLETIVVSGGRRGLQVEVSPEDLADLVGGRFAKISL